MKILVLSDLHYPLTDEADLFRIIREERADKVVFLGDNVPEARQVPRFLGIVEKIKETSNDVILIKGDEDAESLPCVLSAEIVLGEIKFIFVHGDGFNVWSEGLTAAAASVLYKINRKLPALAFAMIARMRSGLSERSEHLVLGHSHALEYFPRLRVACAGCLTRTKNIYNDSGYVVIDNAACGVTLSVKSLLGRVTTVFETSEKENAKSD